MATRVLIRELLCSGGLILRTRGVARHHPKRAMPPDRQVRGGGPDGWLPLPLGLLGSALGPPRPGGEQAQLARAVDGLAPARDVQLAIDAAQVRLDRVGR